MKYKVIVNDIEYYFATLMEAARFASKYKSGMILLNSLFS